MRSSHSRTILIIQCYYLNSLLRFDSKSRGNGRKYQNIGHASIDLDEINLQRWKKQEELREKRAPCTKSTTPPSSPASEPVPGTSSSAKLQSVENECNLKDGREITGFRFVDSELSVSFVLTLLCPNCKHPLGGN